MKMQNTEMELVTFDAKDVIATSGDGYWFQMSAFTDGTWKVSASAKSFEKMVYRIYPVDSNGLQMTLFSKDLNQVFQLTCEKSSQNKFSNYGFQEAYVVAAKADKGIGTKIDTFTDILEWIKQYGQ